MKKLVDFFEKCLAFDELGEEAKCAAAKTYVALLDVNSRWEFEDFPSWVVRKMGEGGFYANDIFALIAMGTGDTYYIPLMRMIGVSSLDFSQQYLRALAIAANNTSFPKVNEAYLKKHKIHIYGTPHNWAKYWVAIAKDKKYGIEALSRFLLVKMPEKCQ